MLHLLSLDILWLCVVLVHDLFAMRRHTCMSAFCTYVWAVMRFNIKDLGFRIRRKLEMFLEYKNT